MARSKKETPTSKFRGLDVRIVKDRVCVPPSYALPLKTIETPTLNSSQSKILEILNKFHIETTKGSPPQMVVRKAPLSSSDDDYATTLLVFADWADKKTPATLEEVTTYIKENEENGDENDPPLPSPENSHYMGC
ncbi:hypothetical protein QBC38DRAFT_453712 [Podospora fimiseda]|uniref:Uncharacterized protein n=1 Tax=Podospora fimiseda TaxID=252190 RepID=A0AAN7BSP4_9PEZI|nr:hypothetical protein QBC38DRAFT_453712 [Podospora fimiseda]